MTADPDVRVQRVGRTDEDEVALFQDAFDNEVIFEETKRFLADDRHHLVLREDHARQDDNARCAVHAGDMGPSNVVFSQPGAARVL